MPDPPGWRFAYVSDCDGSDVDQTVGSADPAPDQCADHSKDGTLAVCWDQLSYKNPASSQPWCTYKQLHMNCNGGSNPGRVYVCYQPL